MEILIKAKFIDNLNLVYVEEGIKELKFEVNKTYYLPLEIAKLLQKEGYCFFIEKAKLIK